MSRTDRDRIKLASVIIFLAVEALFLFISPRQVYASGVDLDITSNTSWSGGTYNYGDLTITNNAILTLQSSLNNTPTNYSDDYGVTINADNITVDPGAKISADQQGYAGGAIGVNGSGPGAGTGSSSGGGGGGGYGAAGAAGVGGAAGGIAYGLDSYPENLGSGGGGGAAGAGGAGGGALILNATLAATVNGTISANGNNGTSAVGSGGGGSGGSIIIDCTNLAGSGAITATGKNGGVTASAGGAGAGGRIRILYSGSNNSSIVPDVTGETGIPGSVIIGKSLALSINHASYKAGAISNTTITFTTISEIPAGGKIEVDFPAGFDLSGALGYVGNNTGSTVAANNNTLTITVGTTVAASSVSTHIISGIKNPMLLGLTGTYSLRTKTAAGVLLDRGTAVAHTMTMPTLTLVTPSDSGISLEVGNGYNITWTSEGAVSDNLTLYYSTNGGTSYPNTIVSSKANDGIYPWTVPEVPAPGISNKVKIQDTFYQIMKDSGSVNFNAGTKNNTAVAGTGLTAAVTLSKHDAALLGAYSTGTNPQGVAFDPFTNSIWVANWSSNTVSKFDALTGDKINDYATGINPYGVAFDSSTNSIWVANNGSNTVSKFNASTGAKINDYATGTNPQGVAFDSSTNSIWVTNWYSNTVSKFNASTGGKIGDYDTGSGPYDVAFDSSTNSIWVVNINSATVSKFNASTGGKINDYATGTSPSAVAFDSSTNSIWVSNWYSATVSKFNASTGAKIGDYDTGTNPYGIAFDSSTNSIWVANNGSTNVSKLNASTGAKVSDYVTSASPSAVAFDSSTNSIWVTNNGSATVSKYSVTSGTKIGDYATGTNPQGVAFDPSTNSIWVTNWYSNTVSKFNASTGAKINDYATGTNPQGIAFDSSTNSIWVVNNVSNTVSKFNASTGAKINDYATGTGPYDVTFDSSTNSIWVVNNGSNTVSKFNASTGAKINDYATGSNPRGVAFDSSTNSIWVANWGSNNVSKFSASDGTKINDYAAGSNPQGIAFDSSTNSIWVANNSSNTVSKFNAATGEKVNYATGSNPRGVAFDSSTNSIWVANWNSNTISKFSASTGAKIGDYATGSGPYGVALDSFTKSIWVVNWYSATVSKFSIYDYVPNGTFISRSLDTGVNSNQTLSTLEYVSVIPGNTTIKLQLAGSDDNLTWSSFIGPGGTSGSYFTSSGLDIPDPLNTKRYLKYKAFFTSTDSTVTAQLSDVSIGFVSGLLSERDISAESANNFTIQFAILHHFIVTSIADPVITGTTVSPVVTAYDANGIVKADYTGTITFTSDDPQAVLPNPYTFLTGDRGTHTFTNEVTLKTLGEKYVKVADGLIVGQQSNITVELPNLDHFTVTSITDPVVAGTTVSPVVTAYDANGDIKTDYTGTITFTSDDPQATLPANYTFLPGDNGVHTFTNEVALKTVGEKYVKVADGPRFGQQSNITVQFASLHHFNVTSITDPVIAGTTVSPVVTACDAYNNIKTDYTGTVTFTSDDPQAVLPTPYTFLPGDNGAHTFTDQVTLKTTGEKYVKVADGLIVGQQSNITVELTTVDHFTVTSITDPVVAGTTVSPVVTAYDVYNNIKADYTGTVTFTSDDPQATLPAPYTFLPGDNGVHTFTNEVALKTVGEKYLKVADGLKVGQQSNITVTLATVDHFTVTSITDPVVAGDTVSPVVTAYDAYNNIKTDYIGTITFSSDDPLATLPANYTFLPGDNGAHTFTNEVVLRTVGEKYVKVADGLKVGQQSNITVELAGVDHFTVTSITDPVVAGDTVSPVVTAYDVYNNIKADYTGTITFTSDDPQATLPAPYTFLPGDNGAHTFTNQATLKTAGEKYLKVADGLKVGQQSNITVTPATVDHFSVTSVPDPVVAGTVVSAVVNAYDSYNNIQTSYTGTVTFTSDDPQAVLPTPYTFLPGDNGTHTFTNEVVLKTAGDKYVKVADGLKVGQQSNITVTPAVLHHFIVASITDPVVAGTTVSPLVTAYDVYNNIKTNYIGTVTFTSDDPQAVLPTPYTFLAGDNGTHTFTNQVTLKTTGDKYVEVADSSKFGQQSGITVTPAAIDHFTVTSITDPVVAGTASSPVVTAYDAYDNVKTDYIGTIVFSSDDTQSILPSSYTFQSAGYGTHTFTDGVILKTVGEKYVRVADGPRFGQQSEITITPAALDHFTVTSIPDPVFAGASASPAVTAYDAYDNVKTDYIGTIVFSSDDLLATLPSNYTFVPLDHGTHIFTNGVALQTLGDRYVKVADGLKVGQQSYITVKLSGVDSFISAKSVFVYDESTDKLAIRVWLEKPGVIITNDTENKLGIVVVNIYDDTIGAWMTPITINPPALDDYVNGVYLEEITNAVASHAFASGRSYYAKIKINYGVPDSMRVYEGGATFSITISENLKATTSAIQLATNGITNQSNEINEIKKQVDEVIVPKITDVKDETAKILTATTGTDSVSSKIADLTTQVTEKVEPQLKSAILNRENMVKIGSSVTIRYRTESGLAPNISVYNPNDVLLVSAKAMTEVGQTGVYQYPLTFLSTWGKGDFTVICSEQKKGTVDALVMTVRDSDIEEVSGNVSAILGNTSGLGGVNTAVSSLAAQFSGIDRMLVQISKDTANRVNEAKGVVNDLATAVKQLDDISKQIKNMGGTKGINLEKLYDVSKDKNSDITYIKNKSEELKATMEINQKMIENVAKKPVVQTWFEFK
jgi:DNA-binding beta-propeller fold protein YncE